MKKKKRKNLMPDYNISFRERARIALEQLAKQPPTTYEKALEQFKRIRSRRFETVKKRKKKV